ncbi:uncharacterized protein TNCV_4290501 [Trichonephila clavipes]|nr:uncharacterized protein TNCV_4290501 [Trichonephila clavipes]
MQVRSGTKNSSSPNEPSCTTITVSFNGVLLVVTGTWCSPYSSPARIRLQTKPGLVGKRHTRPLLWCLQCVLSAPGVKSLVPTSTQAEYSRLVRMKFNLYTGLEKFSKNGGASSPRTLLLFTRSKR